MSCTDIAKYFPLFPISQGTVFAVPRQFCFGTFCPKVKAWSASTEPQLTGFGEAPQQAFWQAFLPPPGAKISSVFTLELLAKNASVATLALLAVSETLFAILVYRLKSYYNTRGLWDNLSQSK